MKKTFFIAWPFAALLLWCAPSEAAPSITSVSQTPSHGQPFTINGSDFGARGDYHGDADKMAQIFDDFDDGEIANNAYENWTVFNGANDPCVISSQSPRTSRTGDYFYRRTSEGLGHLWITTGDQREYLMNFYMRLSPSFDIETESSGTHQFKISRLISSNSAGAGPVNIYPAIGIPDGFSLNCEFLRPEVLRHAAQFNDIPDRPSGWNKFMMYIKKSSRADGNDGRLRVWWNNRLVFDWKDNFSDTSNSQYGVITGDFDNDDGNLAGDWSVGNYFSSASPGTYVDFDDVMLDHTLARVELGNAATYSACTVLEPQLPSSWETGRITVKANTGALSGNMYLYVTDAQGGVNSSGFPVSGSVTPPPPPPPPPSDAAPTVAIVSPAAGANGKFATTNASVALSGTASDSDGTVSTVRWASAGQTGTASGTTSWSVPSVPLNLGDNTVTVTVTDSQGLSSSASLVVERQSATPPPPPPSDVPPVIVLKSPVLSAGKFATTSATIGLSGTASDSDGSVSLVTWASGSQGGNATGTTNWTVASIPLILGNNSVTVTAADDQGNQTPITFVIERTNPPPPPPPPPPAAPVIKISSPALNGSSKFITTADKIALSGTASDADGTVSFVDWLAANGDGGRATGTTAWRVDAVPLSLGNNVFTVTAQDNQSNKSSAEITVERLPLAPPPVAVALPPVVSLWYPSTGTANKVVTGGDLVSLAGTASDSDGQVVSVDWATDQGATGKASGISDWRADNIPLRLGNNLVTITARDNNSQAATTDLVIERRDGAPVLPPPPATPPSGTGNDSNPITQQSGTPLRKFIAPDSPSAPNRAIVFTDDIVEVEIMDFSGRRVYSAKRQDAGALLWDGRSDGGVVDSGVYVCRMKDAEGRVRYHQLAVVR